jgi:hypothetical protein
MACQRPGFPEAHRLGSDRLETPPPRQAPLPPPPHPRRDFASHYSPPAPFVAPSETNFVSLYDTPALTRL